MSLPFADGPNDSVVGVIAGIAVVAFGALPNSDALPGGVYIVHLFARQGAEPDVTGDADYRLAYATVRAGNVPTPPAVTATWAGDTLDPDATVLRIPATFVATIALDGGRTSPSPIWAYRSG